MLAQVFLASCDLVAATLGICDCGVSVTSQIEYQLCATEKLDEKKQIAVSASTSKPQRLCQYFANGTIDIPTLTIIEAYVDIGSRLCIGDEVGSGPSKTSSIGTQIEDLLKAKSSAALAKWLPGDELEIDSVAEFSVIFDSSIERGELLQRPASIRFRPVGYRWIFSDQVELAGRLVERSFADVGPKSAFALVRVRVDYRFDGEDWVENAFQGEIRSNLLQLGVIEKPRRTLLVEG